MSKWKQFCYAMTELSTSHPNVLIEYAKALEGSRIAEQYRHMFKLNIVGAVAGNKVLPPDIITEETIGKIKRYIE